MLFKRSGLPKLLARGDWSEIQRRPKVYGGDDFSWLSPVRVGKRVLRVRRNAQHDTLHLDFYAGSARIFYKSRAGAEGGALDPWVR